MRRLKCHLQAEKAAAPIGTTVHVRGQGSQIAGNKIRRGVVTGGWGLACFCECRHGVRSVGFYDLQVSQRSYFATRDPQTNATDKPLFAV